MKAIPLDGITNWADWGLPWQSPTPSQRSVSELFPFVGYLYRAIDLRANSVASMPWSIYGSKSTKPLWTSEDALAPDNLQPFAVLPDMLYRIEAALCMGSQAFIFKERNRVRLTGLRWLDPFTVEPVWTPQGLTSFTRYVNGGQNTMSVQDVVYIWLTGLRETEPRPAPAQAASNAANVIYNSAQFAKAFFERGAIKAGLLTVNGVPPESERERLKNWWGRFLSGINNAYSTEVVSAAVQYVPVGEGLAELTNQALTMEQREDIATALGVPHSLVMSNAANYATARQDSQAFYETTIVPQTLLIERHLNAQLFGPANLRIKFRPQALDVFQQDENERASAFATYVGAGIKPSIVAQMLGLELPEGVKYEDLDPDPEETQSPLGMLTPPSAAAVPAANAPAPTQTPPANDAPPQEPPAVPPPAQTKRALAMNEPVSMVEDRPAPAETGGQQPHARTATQIREESKRFLRWARKRNNPDLSAFKSSILSDAEKKTLWLGLAELQAGVQVKDSNLVAIPIDAPEPNLEGDVQLWAIEALVESVSSDLLSDLLWSRHVNTADTVADDALEKQVNAFLSSAPEQIARQNKDIIESWMQGRPEEEFRGDPNLAQFFKNTAMDLPRKQLQPYGLNLSSREEDNLFNLWFDDPDLKDKRYESAKELIAALQSEFGKVWADERKKGITSSEDRKRVRVELSKRMNDRIERWARTQVTDVFSTAALEYYKMSPAVLMVEWRTSSDGGEKPCKICGPLNGQRVQTGKAFPGGAERPPAHAGCRCWILPVVDKSKVGQPASERTQTGIPMPEPFAIKKGRPQTAQEARARIDALEEQWKGNETDRALREEKTRQIQQKIAELRKELDAILSRWAEEQEKDPSWLPTDDELAREAELTQQVDGMYKEVKGLSDMDAYRRAEFLKILAADQPVTIGMSKGSLGRVGNAWYGSIEEARIKQIFDSSAAWVGAVVDERIFTSPAMLQTLKDIDVQAVDGSATYMTSTLTEKGPYWFETTSRLQNSIAMSKVRFRNNRESIPKAFVHELGHAIETEVSVLKRSVDFLRRRTEGENAISMDAAYAPYGQAITIPGQTTKPDKFIEPYIGKQDYRDRSGKWSDTDDFFATEVMSKGLEYLYLDAGAFAQQDPDHFDYVWNTIRGRGHTPVKENEPDAIPEEQRQRQSRQPDSRGPV